MSKKLHIHGGSLAPELCEALLDVRKAVESKTFQVLKVVEQKPLRTNDSEYSESSNSLPKNWKRLIVSASADGATPVIIKCFAPGNYARRLYYHLCRREPYRRTYALHQKSKQSAIETVPTLARGEVLNNYLLDYSFLVMEQLENVLSCSQYIEQFLERNAHSSEAKNQLMRWMAQRLSAMHDAGFFHKDIKPYHLYIKNYPEEIWIDPKTTSEWIWIDLDGSTFDSQISNTKRIANLYQFWRYFLKPIEITELEPFLIEYQKSSEKPSQSIASLKRAIERRYQTRVLRSERRS